MSSWSAALVAMLAWWAGTGLLFLLARAADSGRHRAEMLVGASGAALAAVLAAVALREVEGTVGALLGFGVGVAIWAWHELSFLSGAVTGPVRDPCPTSRTGWARFRHAVGAILHHELALAATVLGLGFTAWGAGNALAFWTFLLLWLMRLSAKLNLFLGVPNPNAHLFPARLSHLASLTPSRRMSGLMPVSLLLILGLSAWLIQTGMTTDEPLAGTGAILLGTLALLAWIEHLAMVIPIRIESLWALGDGTPRDSEPNTDRNPMEPSV